MVRRPAAKGAAAFLCVHRAWCGERERELNVAARSLSSTPRAAEFDAYEPLRNRVTCLCVRAPRVVWRVLGFGESWTLLRREYWACRARACEERKRARRHGRRVCVCLCCWRSGAGEDATAERAQFDVHEPLRNRVTNILKQLNEMKRVNTWERQTAGRIARSARVRVIMAEARLAGGLSCLRAGRLLLPAGLRVGGFSSQVRGRASRRASSLARAVGCWVAGAAAWAHGYSGYTLRSEIEAPLITREVLPETYFL
jgi:hypothetical protein